MLYSALIMRAYAWRGGPWAVVVRAQQRRAGTPALRVGALLYSSTLIMGARRGLSRVAGAPCHSAVAGAGFVWARRRRLPPAAIATQGLRPPVVLTAGAAHAAHCVGARIRSNLVAAVCVALGRRWRRRPAVPVASAAAGAAAALGARARGGLEAEATLRRRRLQRGTRRAVAVHGNWPERQLVSHDRDMQVLCNTIVQQARKPHEHGGTGQEQPFDVQATLPYVGLRATAGRGAGEGCGGWGSERPGMGVNCAAGRRAMQSAPRAGPHPVWVLQPPHRPEVAAARGDDINGLECVACAGHDRVVQRVAQPEPRAWGGAVLIERVKAARGDVDDVAPKAGAARARAGRHLRRAAGSIARGCALKPGMAAGSFGACMCANAAKANGCAKRRSASAHRRSAAPRTRAAPGRK